MKIKIFELIEYKQRPAALEEMFQTWYDKEQLKYRYINILRTDVCRSERGLIYVVLYDIPLE